jgi:hypothetical protein
MHINKYQQISIHINKYQYISTHIFNYKQISENIFKYEQIWVHISKYQQISINTTKIATYHITLTPTQKEGTEGINSGTRNFIVFCSWSRAVFFHTMWNSCPAHGAHYLSLAPIARNLRDICREQARTLEQMHNLQETSKKPGIMQHTNTHTPRTPK